MFFTAALFCRNITRRQRMEMFIGVTSSSNASIHNHPNIRLFIVRIWLEKIYIYMRICIGMFTAYNIISWLLPYQSLSWIYLLFEVIYFVHIFLSFFHPPISFKYVALRWFLTVREWDETRWIISRNYVVNCWHFFFPVEHTLNFMWHLEKQRGFLIKIFNRDQFFTFEGEKIIFCFSFNFVPK